MRTLVCAWSYKDTCTNAFSTAYFSGNSERNIYLCVCVCVIISHYMLLRILFLLRLMSLILTVFSSSRRYCIQNGLWLIIYFALVICTWAMFILRNDYI